MKSSKENVKSKKSDKVKDPGKAKNSKNYVTSISQEEIREKANEIYLQRIERGEYGTSESDWSEAEKFLQNSLD